MLASDVAFADQEQAATVEAGVIHRDLADRLGRPVRHIDSDPPLDRVVTEFWTALERGEREVCAHLADPHPQPVTLVLWESPRRLRCDACVQHEVDAIAVAAEATDGVCDMCGSSGPPLPTPFSAQLGSLLVHGARCSACVVDDD